MTFTRGHRHRHHRPRPPSLFLSSADFRLESFLKSRGAAGIQHERSEDKQRRINFKEISSQKSKKSNCTTFHWEANLVTLGNPPTCQFGLSPQAQTFPPQTPNPPESLSLSPFNLPGLLTLQVLPSPLLLRILFFFTASLAAVSSRSRKLHPATSRCSCMRAYRTDSAPKS